MTIFFTTHDMEEADACATLAIMHRGKMAVHRHARRPEDRARQPGATLDDVFIRYTGGTIEPGGATVTSHRGRRTAQRLG